VAADYSVGDDLPVTAVIDDLALEWQALSALGAELTPADWDRPTECPGWTVRDQYAHMIGTESVLLGEAAPPPVHAAHTRNPMGEGNEGWVERWRGRSGPEVLAGFGDVTERRLAALRAMAPEEWEAPTMTPVGPGTYESFMEIRVFDCWVHEQDVRRAVGRPGHLDGPVAAMAMRRVTGALGFVVGKRVAPGDGTSVVVELGAPFATTLAVEVAGGRAGAIAPPPTPTVRIHSDGETWLCLGTGRWTADAALAQGRVTLTGDEKLGRRILEQLATTP
jgi:uncharacterized protein (TIGR03083 family)